MSTFTHAGTSRLNGSVKVRFANDALRVKVLEKNGHTEVDLMPLPNPMTKEEAVAFLLKIEFYKNDAGVINSEKQAAIEDAQERRTPQAGSKDRPKKEAKKPKQPKKPTMEGIVAKVEANKAKATPQVPAMTGMTPLGVKSTAPKTTLTKAEIEAQLKDIEDAPF